MSLTCSNTSSCQVPNGIRLFERCANMQLSCGVRKINTLLTKEKQTNSSHPSAGLSGLDNGMLWFQAPEPSPHIPADSTPPVTYCNEPRHSSHHSHCSRYTAVSWGHRCHWCTESSRPLCRALKKKGERAEKQCQNK